MLHWVTNPWSGGEFGELGGLTVCRLMSCAGDWSIHWFDPRCAAAAPQTRYVSREAARNAADAQVHRWSMCASDSSGLSHIVQIMYADSVLRNNG